MSQRTRPGLSVIEVLIVLAVIGIGISIALAMLIPSGGRVMYTAKRTNCTNNLRQLMLAAEQYESTGRPVTETSDTPAAKLFPPGCVGSGDTPDERLSWMVAVLPYLEQESLYRRFDMKAGYAGNRPAALAWVGTFLCHETGSIPTDYSTHYVAMAGLGADAAFRPAGADGNGFMGYDRPTSAASIKDGLSNTIALMETRSALGQWARGGTDTVRAFDPADSPWCGDKRPFGGHSGGTNVAMADGSVKFIRSGIDPKQLAAAITIAGKEPVDLD
jgi:prepilin-type N-terminal cleavage/methylation domain-containing protein/prepilin-type processing-associated H-X9-DG protein